jgi:hypothetical protein
MQASTGVGGYGLRLSHGWSGLKQAETEVERPDWDGIMMLYVSECKSQDVESGEGSSQEELTIYLYV